MLLLVLLTILSGGANPPGMPCHPSDENLRRNSVVTLAHSILITFVAGSGYPEVWIRDTNTFLEIAMESEVPWNTIRDVLLQFLHLQQPSGAIVDGIRVNTNDTFTNTVETDQETSLVQALAIYIRVSKDLKVLDTAIVGWVDGLTLTVRQRVERAFQYLLSNRYSRTYGLLYGGTTIDWGDVQPENSPGVVFDENSHPSVDIYDNAMMVIALQDYVWLLSQIQDTSAAKRWNSTLNDWARTTREVLWDHERRKWKPHVYFADGDPVAVGHKPGSPFPPSFVEDELYYHGGTAVAALAGLHTRAEILDALQRMQANVVKAGGKVTIGMTVYPPYPDKYFKNGCCDHAYSYQNAGDWPWFGGRMVQALASSGLTEEAKTILKPMVDAVCQYEDFNEWYDQSGKPGGSPVFHGGAGVIVKAIRMLYPNDTTSSQV